MITLTALCCVFFLFFSVLLLNKMTGNMYLFKEMLILLVILTVCIFLTSFITSRLINK